MQGNSNSKKFLYILDSIKEETNKKDKWKEPSEQKPCETFLRKYGKFMDFGGKAGLKNNVFAGGIKLNQKSSSTLDSNNNNKTRNKVSEPRKNSVFTTPSGSGGNPFLKRPKRAQPLYEFLVFQLAQ